MALLIGVSKLPAAPTTTPAADAEANYSATIEKRVEGILDPLKLDDPAKKSKVHDILIAGSTAHDEDDAALQAILDEWTSGNSYNARVSNIRNGGGQNGAFVFNNTTVFDDGAVDTLIGDGGLDWFWIGTNDKMMNRTKNEIVN